MRWHNFWKFAYKSLSESIPIALLFVVQNTSGSPGRRGFKMLITKENKTLGTIGGGVMEHNLRQKALASLKNSEKNISCHPQVHRKDSSPNQSGLICAGSQIVLLYCFYPEDLSLFESFIQNMRQVNSHEDLFLNLNENSIVFSNSLRKNKSINQFYQPSDQSWDYTEKLGPEIHVNIIGGGHVGLAISKILSNLDASINIFDHRENVHTLFENKYANKIFTGPYSEILPKTTQGLNTYTLIVTNSFDTDEKAIKHLINKNFSYIGLMGSSAKITRIRRNLLESGFDRCKINRIHTPIGLAINSRTTDEIAISIAAEIIKHKNTQ